MISCTHCSIGHKVVPGKLATTVLRLVELLHEGDEVLQTDRQRDRDPLGTTGPRP